MPMSRYDYRVASDDDCTALDRLAAELRTNKRARQVADGLPVQEALDAWFCEQAGRTGGR